MKINLRRINYNIKRSSYDETRVKNETIKNEREEIGKNEREREKGKERMCVKD